MTELLDLTGWRFGRLVVIRRAPNRNKRVRWLCKCDCGTQKVVGRNALRMGDSRSCGCLNRELVVERNFKHGHAPRRNETAEFRVWTGMIRRCSNPKRADWEDYGGRGIKVCDRWKKSFKAFLNDMGQRPSSKHLIDRINNDGDYEPSNCRWATSKESHANRRPRRCTLVTAFKKTQTIRQWATEYGIYPQLIRSRLDRGWPPWEAITTPAGEKR